MEELITHENGFHNMMGKEHTKDPVTRQAIYPQTPTLESNKKGNVFPIRSNTIDIINKGVDRGNTHRDALHESLMNNRTRVVNAQTNTIN